MTKRGKVLREPSAGPGLLMAEGRQYQFLLDGVWKSDIPPKPGLAVDIDFDAQGRVTRVAAVPDSRLCQEQARVTVDAGKQPVVALPYVRLAQSEGAQLVAAALLILSCFFLTAVSVELPFTGTVEFTLWQILHSLGLGAYGVLALLAITGPFVHCFWRDRQAAIGGLLPLSFMLLISVALLRNVDVLVANGGDRLYQLEKNHARVELLSACAPGFGTYVSVVIVVYFALLSIKQFRQSQHGEKKEIGQLQKAAA